METLPQILHKAMNQFSGNTALKIKDRAISYGELNNVALSIATFLSQNGIKKENVGIVGQRSFSAYSGILGVIYSGCAYVPINPKNPLMKMCNIIEQAKVRVLIGDQHEWDLLQSIYEKSGNIEYLLIPEGSINKTAGLKVILKKDLVFNKPLIAPIKSALDENVYIIFTSGSTGQPKGVQVSNLNISSFLNNMSLIYNNLEPGFRASQTFDLSFDPSVSDMFFTWLKGGTLCVLMEDEMFLPSEYIKREKIDFWNSVPTLAEFMRKLGALKPAEFPSLQHSMFCGEPFTQSLADAWRKAAPNSTIENLYGPTEATIYVIRHDYLPEHEKNKYHNGIIPIGHPFNEQEIVLIDGENNIVTGKDTGEMIIKGSQVTKGYLNDTDKTSKAYVKMPWDSGKSIWYRTGDLAFYNKHGELECIGRKDNQIKLTGRRVEIGEIEYHLKCCGSFEEVIVVPYRDDNKVPQGLVAYVTAELTKAEIKTLVQKCKERLENIFIPKRFIYIEKVPVTNSGKVNRVILEKQAQEVMTK